jgi:hypothetical protein
LARVEILRAEGNRVLVSLRWQPGDAIDSDHPRTDDTKPLGFRLTVQPLDDSGHPIDSSEVEMAVPGVLISRRIVEPPVYTGSLTLDPDSHTLTVVVGESSRATLFTVASEFTVQTDAATGHIELIKRQDRFGEYRSATIRTELPDGKRPLIASVERVDDEIVLGIAPWQPGEARAQHPPAIRRARLTADFREIIAVEPIPEQPPPADQPADPPPSDPPPPPSEPE